MNWRFAGDGAEDVNGAGDGAGHGVGDGGGYFLLKFFKFAYAASNGFGFNWLTERNPHANRFSRSLSRMQYIVYMETVLPIRNVSM